MITEHKEILLLTGLGSDKVVNRQTRYAELLNRKRPVDAQILVFPTLWQTPEFYAEKKQRLDGFIAANSGIELVYAISAGGSLGVSLIPELPDETIYHFMCGKLLNPGTIEAERRERAPALFDSVTASQRVVEDVDLGRYDITCHYGFMDGVLSKSDQLLPDTLHHRIPMINHSLTIAVAYPTILQKL